MATKKGKNSDSVSERLAQLLESKRLSKADFARAISVSNAHVANWLAGQLPRADQLLRIAKHFGVSMEWLLTGDPPPGLPHARAEPTTVLREEPWHPPPRAPDNREKEAKAIAAEMDRLAARLRSLF